MILDRILRAKRAEVAERKEALPLSEVEHAAYAAMPPRDFPAALRRAPGTGIRLIAEFKRASPSKGVIRNDLGPVDVAREYAEAGAAAMSVLTDGPFFSGSLDDLRAVRAAVELPLLRKDFILDSYQIIEARAAGADAVLLIAAALSEKEMERLQDETHALGMAVLVEVHDEADLARALAVGAEIIGVNNRDLRTFRVDFETTLRLKAGIPAGTVVVSESGIRTRGEVRRLEAAGIDAILVGETLMRQPHPGEAAKMLLG